MSSSSDRDYDLPVHIPVVGTRVTVRYRLPAGSTHPLTDVVGEIVSSGERLVVRRRTGDTVSIAPEDVVLVREVPPAAPRPAQVRELETVAARGWPGTASAWVDGWLLRSGDGFTARANSATALRPGADFAALPALCRWYESRGLPPQLQLLPHQQTPPGWSDHRATILMTGDVRLLGESRTELADHPDSEWLALFGRGADRPEAIAVLTAVDDGTVTFASFRIDGAVAGIARGAVTEAPSGQRWLGLSSLQVAEPFRRRGAAGAIMGAVGRWGAQNGATMAYLQVMADNSTAIRMYQRMGFAEHHRYRYAIR